MSDVGADVFRQRLIALVTGPLQDRRPSAPRVAIDGRTRLFEEGVIDSLSVIELIAFVEEETGKPVPPRMVDLKHFGTIDRICSAFCSPVESTP